MSTLVGSISEGGGRVHAIPTERGVITRDTNLTDNSSTGSSSTRQYTKIISLRRELSLRRRRDALDSLLVRLLLEGSSSGGGTHMQQVTPSPQNR